MILLDDRPIEKSSSDYRAKAIEAGQLIRVSVGQFMPARKRVRASYAAARTFRPQTSTVTGAGAKISVLIKHIYRGREGSDR